MSPGESTSTTDGDRIGSTMEPQPESPETDTESVIAWGPVEYGRIRSVVAGGAVAIAAAVGVSAARLIGTALSGGSVPVEALLVGGLLVATSWPALLVFYELADDTSTDTESNSVRERLGLLWPDWSWLRPRWAAVGAGGTITAGWWLGAGLAPYAWAPILGGIIPLLFGFGRRYRLDPTTNSFEFESTTFDQSWNRALDWLVGVRRLNLGGLTLFVCSNRGKRWYEGIHLLPVPAAQADAVDDALRQAAETGPPRRVKRDERILFGTIGASMIGVGPFLYLLSSEPALLFILAGPSTLIGLGVVLHALRG